MGSIGGEGSEASGEAWSGLGGHSSSLQRQFH